MQQDSKLGQFLFLMFINVLCESLKCYTLLLADDFNMIYPLTLGTTTLSYHQLFVLQNWCERNVLT